MTKVIILTRYWTSWPDFAGSTWVPIQYMTGFRRLGVEAIWVDAVKRVDPFKRPHSIDYLMDRFDATARDFGFADRYCVIYDHGKRHYGLDEEGLREHAGSADLLLAISGKGIPKGSPLARIERRAYVDVDPAYTQMWAHEVDMGLDQFNVHFTVGLNVGTPEFRIPTLGYEWHTMLPPVCLDLWPANVDERCRRFSTVGDWWGKQYMKFNGEYYGSKRDEFLRFVSVPRQADQTVEAALTVHQGDHKEIGELNRNNWQLLDPYMYAGDPHSYREFIRFSRAEFSVAKSGYVKSRSGWFSDRSACYLASGKPVVVQSTGLETRVKTGCGLLTFTTPQEAVAAIHAVNADYMAHAHAARAFAEEYLDSDAVLGSLLGKCGC